MTAPQILTDIFTFNLNLETHDGAAAPPLAGQSFLHELSREGDVLSAEVIMNAGGEIDLPDEEGRRPLHEAAFFGSLPMVRFLIENGALVDAPIHPFGTTALVLAVQQGHTDIVQYLLERGASRSVEDRLSGHGLLHIAAMRGDMRMAGILIAAGISVFQEDRRGRTARDHAAKNNHKTLEAVLLKVMEHHARFCH